VAVCVEGIQHLRDKMKNNAHLRCGPPNTLPRRSVLSCRATFSEIQPRKRAVRTTILETVPEPLIPDELWMGGFASPARLNFSAYHMFSVSASPAQSRCVTRTGRSRALTYGRGERLVDLCSEHDVCDT
jgi:hypothetical protein